MFDKRSACACALATVLFASAASADTGSLTLAWNANSESDLAGYLVHYGTQQGTYTGTVDVGSQTSAVISNLTEGQQYFFAVQAYSTAGLSSNLSQEVAGVVPTQNPAGLVAAFGFEETSGSITTDMSPLQLTGTLAGAARTANGKYGRALSFDGVDDWVTVADSAALDLTTGMTIEAWVNPSSLTGWRSVIMKENGSALAYGLYANDNDPKPATYVRIAGNTLSEGSSGSTQLPANVWSHLAATYDGANLRIFVNGALVNTQPVSGNIATTTGPLRIGGNSMWGEYFSGLIDEVRIYNRALSQGEISVDMGAAVVNGLVAAYGFEETSGAATLDTSGNGNNGTKSGASRVAGGRFGRALNFDGVDDWVTIPDAPALDLTTAMTVEAWVNPTNLTGWRPVVMKENGSTALAYALYANDNDPKPATYVRIAGQTVSDGSSGPTALAPNTWTHLAATYDGANLRIFVNGSLVNTQPVSGNIAVTAGPLRIGGNSVWGEYFAGKIDEVRVYNRALTAQEVQADMNQPVP